MRESRWCILTISCHSSFLKENLTLLTASHIIASASALALLPAAGFAQLYKIQDAVVAVGGTGQVTISITSQNNVTHEASTDSVGFLDSFREHPVAWLASR